MRPTSLPWCIKHLKPGNPKSRKYHEISIVEGEKIYPGGNWNIAYLNPSHHSYKHNLALANAELILRACKCHEELVEACEKLVKIVSNEHPYNALKDNDYKGLTSKTIIEAKQALAKAKELGG